MPELPWLTSDLPGVPGRLKVQPEDFFVEEIPAYPPCGEGEHLFLWIEKADVPADGLVRHLCQTLGVARDDVGVAGLKDRRAVTRQFVSIPARAAERVEAADTESVRILSAQRHTNKLKTGHLKGNRFSILLREPAADDATAAPPTPETRLQRAERIAARLREVGVPNYYGEQRFGIGGETSSLGFDLLRGIKSTRDIPHAKRKFLLRLALSAAQSELFNTALADRMSREQLRTVLVGDVMRKSATGGLFTTTNAADEQPRLDAGELQITGPIFGPKMQQPQDEPAEREAALLEDAGLTIGDFSRYPKLTSGTRRPYLIDVSDLKVSAEADGLRFDFALPAGAYTTVLLREITKQA